MSTEIKMPSKSPYSLELFSNEAALQPELYSAGCHAINKAWRRPKLFMAIEQDALQEP